MMSVEVEKKVEKRLIERAITLAGDRAIKSICIGYGITAVEMEDGALGTCAILREHCNGPTSHLKESGTLCGMKARSIIPWLINEASVVKRSIALAVVNALSEVEPHDDQRNRDAAYLPCVDSYDILGVIGYITPVVKNLAPRAKSCYIFDNSLSSGVQPPEKQAELLPYCSVVFITGTSFINNTINQVLSYCRTAEKVVLVGPSTPLYPEIFADTPVTLLAGSLWPSERKEEIFHLVSQAAGIHQLSTLMTKVTLPVTRGS